MSEGIQESDCGRLCEETVGESDHCEDVGFYSEMNGELLQGVELDKRHDLTQVLQRSLHPEDRMMKNKNSDTRQEASASVQESTGTRGVIGEAIRWSDSRLVFSRR